MTGFVRREDWLAQLAGACEAAAARPFDWAGWDCCSFVASAVEAMTGADPLVEYRGRYAGEAEAWAALAAQDGNLRQACRRIFGGMIRPAFARRGDVVLKRGGMAIGICLGTDAVFVSPDGEGLVRLPMTDCSWAFPLGWAPAPEPESEPLDG